VLTGVGSAWVTSGAIGAKGRRATGGLDTG